MEVGDGEPVPLSPCKLSAVEQRGILSSKVFYVIIHSPLDLDFKKFICHSVRK